MGDEAAVPSAHRESTAEDQPNKRQRLEQPENEKQNAAPPNGDATHATTRRKGVAPVKAEYLITDDKKNGDHSVELDADAAEAGGPSSGSANPKQKQKKGRGQNTHRTFGSSRDKIPLCSTRVVENEFSPGQCQFGAKCKYEHNLRKYLSEGKRENLLIFEGQCPIFEARGWCNAGWKCRFAVGHSMERTLPDGRTELVLLGDKPSQQFNGDDDQQSGSSPDVFNIASAANKIALKKRQIEFPKSTAYLEELEKAVEKEHAGKRDRDLEDDAEEVGEDVKDATSKDTDSTQNRLDNSAQYKETHFLPSEKRPLYYGPDTPILAPLTTQGNLPFRRLCTSLGAQLTWSEMAMSLPLIQGQTSEWALMKAHSSELSPPRLSSKTAVVRGYENDRDLKFGAQIAANKPWLATKATEALSIFCPRLRAIDLNCGCPIDLVYKIGAGSALLDSPLKLERILRGMNRVSGETPVTVKIRTGTKDGHPNALNLISRLITGSASSRAENQGPCGVAAIALHGRTRQQRYTRSADWSYIAECAALIRRLNTSAADATDTSAAPDARDLPNTGHSDSSGSSNPNHVYFVGNGDCYSHTNYTEQLTSSKVDAVMVGRGALVKPWIFEEIEAGQHLDKSASERLGYVERFVRFGLEAWGSDEIGVGTTRRFLLEWLNFASRYVPVGLLEVLPPRMNDRPPRYRGRNEMETLLSSSNYKDWLKISEMFLGPAHPNFKFEPKHKSNSYEAEG